MTRVTIEIAIAPSAAFGNETIRPMSAAVIPASSVFGPIDTSWAEVWFVAMRITDSADRKPAIVHTAVDIIFGLTPVRRARSAFVAAARTDSPNAVRPSSHHSPNVMIGTTIRTRSCGPVRVIDPSSHRLLIGVGYCVENSPVWYDGSVRVTARANSATPIVATSTMTRGALARRRITVSSTTVPLNAPSTSAPMSANQ